MEWQNSGLGFSIFVIIGLISSARLEPVHTIDKRGVHEKATGSKGTLTPKIGNHSAKHEYNSLCHANGTCTYTFSLTLHSVGWPGQNLFGMNNNLQADSPFGRSLTNQLESLNQAIKTLTQNSSQQNNGLHQEFAELRSQIKRASTLSEQVTKDGQHLLHQFGQLKNDMKHMRVKLSQNQTQIENMVNGLRKDLQKVEMRMTRMNVLNSDRTGESVARPGQLKVSSPDSPQQGDSLDLALGPAKDCAWLRRSGINESGVYEIQPDPDSDSFKAYCDMETDGGGWTVVQRREDGLVDFQKTWREYNNGFGDPESEHWLGLQKMYLLNQNGNTKIRFDLWQFKDNKHSYAEYKKFKLSDESDRYRLRIGRYSGTAGDSFHYGHYYLRHNGQRFSTFDLDNDASSSRNCAQLYHGGWWFANCMASNLNGIYYVGHQNGEYQSYTRDGIMWQTLDGYRSLMETEIKVRPAKFKCC